MFKKSKPDTNKARFADKKVELLTDKEMASILGGFHEPDSGIIDEYPFYQREWDSRRFPSIQQ